MPSNPAVRRAVARDERGAVANDAWNRLNALNAAALTAAAPAMSAAG